MQKNFSQRNVLATRNDITRFIPQRPPVVMVDNLIEATDNHAVTQLFIETDNVFVFEGHFSEPGMVENIAQTAAVHIGFQCVKHNVPIPIGYIAAVKDLRVNMLPREKSLITTSVLITNKVLDVTVVEGKVELNGEVMCSCEMRIFAKVQLPAKQ
jgi:3-hydroxyacyl-[acyl-carrier-protein] dehydratase